MLPPTKTSVLRRLGGLLREETRALSIGTVLLVAGSALSLVYPQGIRLIVDGAIAGRDPTAVTRAAGLLALIAIVQGFAVGGRHVLFSLAGERGVRRVRERLYQRLLEQEIGFFDSSRTGELISRLGTDSATIQSLVAANVSMVFRHVITALGGIGLLFVTSPRLTVVMLLVVPPIAVGSVSTAARSARSRAATRTRSPTPRHVAEESLSAMRTVRAFNAEPAERARYEAAIADSYEAAPAAGARGLAVHGRRPRPASTSRSPRCSATAASSSRAATSRRARSPRSSSTRSSSR